MRNIILVLISLAIISCGGTVRHKDSIGSLSKKKIKVSEPIIDDALDKAMLSYKKFLTENPGDSETAPEAMRRLADLQLEKGAGTYDFVKDVKKPAEDRAAAAKVKQESIAPDQFGKSAVASPILGAAAPKDEKQTESNTDFEKRSTQISDLSPVANTSVLPEDSQEAVVNANTDEAIALYKKLLEKYPLYDRNDQVMYQLARAYEDGARQEEAKAVLDKLVVKYPTSPHYDEAQFRRGEIFFVRKKYFDAEQAYTEVINKGSSSAFYDQALFKRGWCLFKQSMYEEALDDYVLLLDAKTAAGFHIRTETNKTEYQRVEDTFRVVSLSFSYLQGADSIATYFQGKGARDYEYLVYRHLAEHYLTKRRYQDSAYAYNSFLDRYPMHEKAPEYHKRVIEIYRKGLFPKLVIEAKRAFAIRYDINGEYWSYHDLTKYPETLEYIKKNLDDLAKHYHAVSQTARKRNQRKDAYLEAARWYRTYLASFPEDPKATELNFLLAELLFDNKAYREAAEEYEKTAYAYPVHPKSAESGYAAILAYREYEKRAPVDQQAQVHTETIRSSLQFAETYPKHKQAAAVLTSAAENLYGLREYERAQQAARSVVDNHPKAEAKLTTAAWIVIAHTSFDLKQFVEAEQAYTAVVKRIPRSDKRKAPLLDKLAASVYKQAEEHQVAGEQDAAVEDYMRIANVAPQSTIRETAEFDAATLLVTMKAWSRAAEILQDFRKNFPKSKRQFEVTSKLALVYEEDGKSAQAASEFERIAKQTKDKELQREALARAALLYTSAENYSAAINMHKRYMRLFPKPLEPAMEARNSLAELYKKSGNKKSYKKMLEEIVRLDKSAGKERTDRTRYLAANALFVLTEPVLNKFKDARLGEPFKKTMANKKRLMKKALAAYGKVADYEIAEMTSATTFQIASIYYEFSQDLLESQRPKGLSEDELLQYELLLEEQAYPFEEKAISIHEKNLELLTTGIFNKWITYSLNELAKLIPAQYDKPEQEESYFASIY